ncbi:MAG TPA: Gfo/Idh/MocA family oxidoreductase [Candidatus Limnocylindrales bacterium]|nr:Gfo/Idh/MocA family oxidoreductase [Candidatus Limnocylindrales bacterium]
MKNLPAFTRRQFLSAAATTVAGFTIVPRHVIAASGETPPSEKINIAGIGVGGQGAGDLDAVANGNNIVALCDVDERHAGNTFKKYPDAKRYRDFRRMFDEMHKGIDAVVVATPDHFHAVAGMAAIKHGKHLYCEKPLAHSIHEVRELMKAAKKYKIITQLGNQGHSFGSIRDFCEWVWDGAIGNVHTIHAGCRAINSGIDQLPRLQEHHDVPPTLDWDQWLGPAQQRPYHPAYLPGAWRGWTPFGNGTVGDWTCHVVDPVFWALDLGAPSTITAQVKNYDPKTQSDAFPKGEIITYEFPGNKKRGPVTMHWYSGTERIPRPPELDADEKDPDTGAVVIGDKGTIMYGSHGAGQVRLIPQTKMDAYKKPTKTIPRAKEHHQDWLDAIRNNRKAGSDFSYGGPLTEIALLGVIALKMPGTKLEWNAAKGRFTNCNEANEFLNPPYRSGWKL